MTIGVCGPVDLHLLDWELKNQEVPQAHTVPLTSHIVNGFLKRGFKVVVYTNSHEVEEPRVYKTEQLTVCIGRQKPQPGRRFFQFEVNELKTLIDAHPADFITAFWSYEYAWAALKTGIPTVVSLHDVASQILLNHKDLFRVVRWIINEIVVSKATHLIANSAYTYDMLRKSLQAKTQVINNLYPNRISAMNAAPAKKENYIITVAQGFSRRKNVDTALRAFALLRKQHPTLEYHLVGVDMEEGGHAQEFAEAHNLAEGVKFIGCVSFEEVMERIARARAMLHPAREESFGMVLLEAMVTNVPVVGGDKSGFVPYLLNHGEAGVLADINSPEDICRKVSQLLTDEDLYAKMVHNGYRFAHDNFSEDVIIEKHLAYYAQAYGKPLQPDFKPSEDPDKVMGRELV